LNEQKEGEFIVDQILKLKYENPDFKNYDFSVLYRTNAQSRAIEEYLLTGVFLYFNRRNKILRKKRNKRCFGLP